MGSEGRGDRASRKITAPTRMVSSALSMRPMYSGDFVNEQNNTITSKNSKKIDTLLLAAGNIGIMFISLILSPLVNKECCVLWGNLMWYVVHNFHGGAQSSNNSGSILRGNGRLWGSNPPLSSFLLAVPPFS